MSNQLNRSELIRDRLFECLENGEINCTHEVEIIEHLFKRLNLLPLSDYAKQSGISYNGAKKRVESGREMYIEVGGVTLVSF